MCENDGNLLRRWDGELIARSNGGDDSSLTLATLTAYPHGLGLEDGDHLAAAPDYAGDGRGYERRADYGDRIYGRVVEDGGMTWLQYWFWFYYNPKRLLAFGAHEGDWEMIQVGLDPQREPKVATYAQHRYGEPRRWREVPRYPEPDGPHPIVYVATLSHASYFTPGSHPYLGGVDNTFWPQDGRAEGPATVPKIEAFGDWARWPGLWGDRAPALGKLVGSGPPSPGHQAKWHRPAQFHRRARSRVLARGLGHTLKLLGRLTFPDMPELVEARIEGDRVTVSYRLTGHALHRSRHLYLTVHTPDGEYVLASRVVRDAAPGGEETMIVPHLGDRCLILASAFNWLRQRSNVEELPAQRY